MTICSKASFFVEEAFASALRVLAVPWILCDVGDHARIEDAVIESQRCVKELGFRGVFLRPNLVNGRTWHDPYYEPLWATLEALGVPIGFHEGDTSALPHVGE
jgi:predicted TIM-barrel fold metal-dependent hydrolase